MPRETKSIKGVEVFAAGVWNGDEYSVKDLDEMVRAFEENKEGFRPPLKLGHDDEQKLLQNDGLPAAGWITNLYRKGKKLLADFERIPSVVFDLLEKGAYRKVSSEIYWNLKLGEKDYRRVLGAVALLGADNPGVTNLKDILAMYGVQAEARVYSEAIAPGSEAHLYLMVNEQDISTGDKAMPEKNEELQKELLDEKRKREELESRIQKFELEQKSAKETHEAELAALKKQADESQATIKEYEARVRSAQVDKAIAELDAAGLVSPSMKPFVKALIGEEKKEYSVKVKDAEKTYSKSDLVKELLAVAKKAYAVNLEENSEDGTDATHENPQEAAIHKYMTDHKVTYGEAYRSIMNQAKGA